MGNPLTPTSPFIDKNIITGCYCNNIYGENAILGCFHPIVPPSPAMCLKIQFLAIYPHLRIPMGYPLSIFHFFLTGCVGWNIVLLISSEKFGTFSFFEIFFHYFCPFFRKNYFLAYLPPFNAPHVIFSFFSDWMCWVAYSFTYFK